MRILALALPVLILFIAGMRQDSPHGSEFKISCSVCHSPKGWDLDREIYAFDHDATRLPLEGQHKLIECRKCHPTLVFTEANTDCFSCHTDMHNQTVGMECSRCHTPASWIVENVTDIHRQSRFPLQGSHFAAQCQDCHPSASLLRFEPLGVECMDCHMQDYQSATNPNHVSGNFSTQCIECHLMTAFTWEGSGYNHSFFPLTGGHEIYDCKRCHTGTDYSNISAACFSCHQADYNATTNPNHLTSGLSTDCKECHSTSPGWKPASFKIHDAEFFPIYSGSHRGEWDDCTECHSNPANYSIFSCIDCHEHNRSRTDNQHREVRNFQYNSEACLDCHPIGKADD